ncbi:MAG: T9SS type A sorting domain-containing protein [Bacteroidales bacterium]|nr:T9SS type A sorting domain-containing protein [Bacteroidales bacterium]
MAVIAVYTSGWNPNGSVPLESPEEPGAQMMLNWGNSNGHALTIVGYNDEIYCFDINNDGEYTIDQDVDGDGDVDMFDCEKGAFKIANTWGEGFGDDGFIFVPYKVMVDGLQIYNAAYICKSHGDYEPQLAVKASIEYPERDKLGVKVGYAQNANQSTPLSSTFYRSFKYQGGPYDMRGAYPGPIEIGLDFGYWYLTEDVGKIFLIVDEDEEGTPTDGTVDYFSIVDYRWGEVFELYCDESNAAIVNDDQTILSVDYDLIPHESNISANLSLFSNMVSRFTPTVDNNATLSVEDGVRVDMYDSEIHINYGSTLEIGDNVKFLAKTGNCKIIVDGDISVGSNVSFIAEDGAQLELVMNNYATSVTFDNTTFEGATFDSYAQNLTISSSTFDDCFIVSSHRGNVTVKDETSFDRTWLYLENIEDNLNVATVSNCIFTTNITMAAIDLWNYNLYSVENNTIEGFYNGIQIIQCGYGDSKKNMINDNTITNCTQRGILAYSTRGAIYKNHISNNRYGVWFGDYSSMRLYGYSGAANPAQTQEIRDNDFYEVYASQYSFPIYFRYNVIVDDDNIGGEEDALVFHNVGNMSIKDVRYNCWEEITGSFNPSQDLYGGAYIWEPTWCPGSGSGTASNPDEDMFEVAGNLFEAEDYTGAKTMYETLIEQYPQSKLAKAAMQELFALEKFVTNDYNCLKQYYDANATIQAYPDLAETGDYMVSKCDIKLENWPGAISYYENIILDPETMEDSIFAIVDLGYVYFVMENSGYKSAYTGNMVQYKPESKEQFFDYRNYLLSLIPGDQMSETMKGNISGLKAGALMQNVPNPFKGRTQIWYKLENESTVQVNVYNYTGQLITSINEGTKTKGNHYIDFDATGLQNGIYFYSISINGQTTDSKKMTVLK